MDTRPLDRLTLPLLALALAACSGDARQLPGGNEPDAAAPGADAGTEALDASAPDAEAPQSDDSKIELGTVHLENGLSEAVTFELPADVAAFVLIIDGPDDTWFVPQRLHGPTGNLVSDDASGVSQLEQYLLGPYAAQFKSPNRVVQDLGLAASLFPNNPQVTVTGGQYTLRIGGLVPTGQGVPFTGDVTVQILIRRRLPSAGGIAVHLHFTGAGGIQADNAAASPLIQGAIQRLGEIYAEAGIEILGVDYFDIDPAFQSIEDLQGTGGDLEQLFQTSAGRGPGLSFFFVDRFAAAIPGATVAGIAGGLPGAPHHPGSVGAGVAVALAPANGDSNVLAHVMAHEGGHWLGLFHTSEITGTEDQHPETPSGQAGKTHLMYPAVGGGTQISPSQGSVLRSHMEVNAR